MRWTRLLEGSIREVFSPWNRVVRCWLDINNEEKKVRGD